MDLNDLEAGQYLGFFSVRAKGILTRAGSRSIYVRFLRDPPLPRGIK